MEDLAPRTTPDLTPPTESNLTTVLNGIGNGAMIGVLPVGAYKLYGMVQGKELTGNIGKMTAFASAIGCTIGAVFGYVEAQKLKQYRRDLSSEVIKLRADFEANRHPQQEAWCEQVKQRAESALAEVNGRG